MGWGIRLVASFGCALFACGGEADRDGRGRESAGTGGVPTRLNCDAVRLDPAIETTVRTELGKPSGALTAAQLTTVERLESSDVASLAGIECLTHLRALAVHGGSLEDLSPLAALPDFMGIWMEGTGVRSLAPLALVPKLRSVELYDSEVSDLTPLGELPSLQVIVVRGKVSDVSPLANMPNLETLDLSGCPLSNLSGLGTAPVLSGLLLSGTNITSLDFDAPKLSNLYVGGTPLRDISSLGRFPSLSWFSAASTQIEDISSLGELSGLYWVDVSETKVHDISPLLRHAPAGKCPQIWVAGAPLDEPLASEVVPRLCDMGWAMVWGYPTGQCHPECMEGP